MKAVAQHRKTTHSLNVASKRRMGRGIGTGLLLALSLLALGVQLVLPIAYTWHLPEELAAAYATASEPLFSLHHDPFPSPELTADIHSQVASHEVATCPVCQAFSHGRDHTAVLSREMSHTPLTLWGMTWNVLPPPSTDLYPPASRDPPYFS